MEKIVSVTELSNAISVLLTERIGVVTVRGEISNLKYHSSGHKYFTLKDEGAQISCTLWRSRPLSFQMTDGMKVIVRGEVTVYPPQGKYQIECHTVTPEGQGDLYLAFEALKKKLEEKGYFEKSRKKPLPDFPLKIGISTSPTGAAVQDMLSTLGRRMPLCEIYFRPTLVQGEGSAEDIVRAIKEIQAIKPDVIIIGRGGGSLEDLWSYNTEIVAEAVFNSAVPIISAVGHETDFTISDFVADVRAATPTAAAELVTRITMDYLLDEFELISEGLARSVLNNIEKRRDKLNNLENSYPIRRFTDKIRTQIQKLDDTELMISKAISNRIINKAEKLKSLESHFRSLHPLSPLQKGFALLRSDKSLISKRESLARYKNIKIVRADEEATAAIKEVKQILINDII